MREITICPVLNGWIVTCGCAEVVFDNLAHMLLEVERYYTSPEDVEKEYLSRAKNKLAPTVKASGQRRTAEIRRTAMETISELGREERR